MMTPEQIRRATAALCAMVLREAMAAAAAREAVNARWRISEDCLACLAWQSSEARFAEDASWDVRAVEES